MRTKNLYKQGWVESCSPIRQSSLGACWAFFDELDLCLNCLKVGENYFSRKKADHIALDKKRIALP